MPICWPVPALRRRVTPFDATSMPPAYLTSIAMQASSSWISSLEQPVRIQDIYLSSRAPPEPSPLPHRPQKQQWQTAAQRSRALAAGGDQFRHVSASPWPSWPCTVAMQTLSSMSESLISDVISCFVCVHDSGSLVWPLPARSHAAAVGATQTRGNCMQHLVPALKHLDVG